MASHSQLLAVAVQFVGGELSSTVGAQRAHLPLRLALDLRHEALDRLACLVLRGQQREPHVSVAVINKEKKVPLSSWCRGRDRTAQVSVDEVEQSGGAVQGLLLEWAPSLLSGQAAIANLPDALDQRKATHYLALGELAECVEVDVAVL
jgi:hypothetical protein